MGKGELRVGIILIPHKNTTLNNIKEMVGIIIIKTLAIIVPLLISIAYFTLAERKVLGYIQCRKEPNVVGAYEIVQPLADGVNLFTKKMVIPNHANIFIYFMAPFFR